MNDANGNAAQIRTIADSVAEGAATIAISKFVASHPEFHTPPKPEIPAPLKWAGGIVAMLLTLGIGGTATWLVTTVNTMQVTLARMDERMSGGSIHDGRVDDLERRVQLDETRISTLTDKAYGDAK